MKSKEKYTFDNFVVGECNKLAYEASAYAAKNPGKEYNPLFIWGDTGLGKTHLLHAIQEYMCGYNPEKTVIFVDAEWFTKEVVRNIRYSTMPEFRDKYRTVDVLILDNLQHIIGKKSTLEEFFHTFDALYSTGKQIIITADNPPKEMNQLNEKFKSRLSCGLMIHIQVPDYNMKRKFVQELARSQQIGIEEEVSNYIAASIDGKIPKLAEIMNHIFWLSKHNNEELNMELVARAIEESKQQDNNVLSLQFIIDSVAQHFDITSNHILSTQKSKEVLYPRQIAMYLCNTLTSEPKSNIGKVFGRDHGTVKYGIDKMKRHIQTDDKIKNEIETIKNSLLK